MPLFEAVRLALAQIRAQKLKSFFTLVGVTIGVMFLIGIVSIVEGMGRLMEQDIVGKLIPINSYELRARPSIVMGDVDDAEWRAWRNRPPLTEDDAALVAAALPAGDRWAMVSEGRLTLESAYARPRPVSVSAVSADWFAIKGMAIPAGRAFTDQEDALSAPVIVIGEDVRAHFFPNVDAVGRTLRIGSLPYTVVGVVEEQGRIFGQSMDAFAVVPFHAPAGRLLNRFGIIDALLVQSPTAEAMLASMESVRQTMRVRHRLRPSRPDDFSMQTSDAALAAWRRIQGYLVWAGVALPAIGLIVGAIVIMNIMLVAVAERTHEIGIRKALGARRGDIRRQFLVEATTLSTVGAVLGIMGGAALARLIATVSPLPTAVAFWSVLVAVGVGLAVGILSGVYPATRAARLDPIAALRQE